MLAHIYINALTCNWCFSYIFKKHIYYLLWKNIFCCETLYSKFIFVSCKCLYKYLLTYSMRILFIRSYVCRFYFMLLRFYASMYFMHWFYTLKNKIENNSTWEVAFHQSEWVKNNSSCVIFCFFTLCVLLLLHLDCFVWPI